jgi:hypothetical protein
MLVLSYRKPVPSSRRWMYGEEHLGFRNCLAVLPALAACARVGNIWVSLRSAQWESSRLRTIYVMDLRTKRSVGDLAFDLGDS